MHSVDKIVPIQTIRIVDVFQELHIFERPVGYTYDMYIYIYRYQTAIMIIIIIIMIIQFFHVFSINFRHAFDLDTWDELSPLASNMTTWFVSFTTWWERTWARNTDSCCMTWKISFMFSNSIYLKSNLHLWKKVWPCYHFFKYLLSMIRRLSHETHWDLCWSNHTGLMLNVEAWFFWLNCLGARTSQTRKWTPHKWDYKFDNVYIT